MNTKPNKNAADGFAGVPEFMTVSESQETGSSWVVKPPVSEYRRELAMLVHRMIKVAEAIAVREECLEKQQAEVRAREVALKGLK